ncbi:uncharacterized protein LOC133931353 [Phragmites australis]|uniref:uncharacterized protein LOC133931353 n=1 Tax=Phragmites australis TaxID=29695 RepID=UPI002D77204E|nr:uncharacterized protein LOC133931353 [Phragmites australis]
MEAYGVNKSNRSEELKLPLALFAVKRNSKRRLLFDVSSREIRGVSSPVFPEATCAFENGGWLLMIRHKPLCFQEQIVFLVHPSSGRRLDLPAVHSCDKAFFVFYVDSHGAPLVVARIEIWSLVPTIHIACPGDVYWSVYQHDADPPRISRAMRRVHEPTCFADVALLGTQAICLDLNGEILVFDVTEMAWRRTVSCPEGSKQDANFLVASNGEVVLVSRSHTMENAFKFFKLEMEVLDWSPLSDWELDGTSWFLRKGQSFRVKEAGKRKVYTFDGPKQSTKSASESSNSAVKVTTYFSGTSGHDETLKSITNIYAYDLDDGTVEMVIPASIVTEARHWVQPGIFATPAK